MRITQKITKRIRHVFLVAILIATVGIITVFATGVGYSIPWWTIDGGGGTSSGSNYTVSGTIRASGYGNHERRKLRRVGRLLEWKSPVQNLSAIGFERLSTRKPLPCGLTRTRREAHH